MPVTSSIVSSGWSTSGMPSSRRLARTPKRLLTPSIVKCGTALTSRPTEPDVHQLEGREPALEPLLMQEVHDGLSLPSYQPGCRRPGDAGNSGHSADGGARHA